MIRLTRIKTMWLLIIMAFGVISLAGCEVKRVAVPFTKEQILTYLEEKYDKEFVFIKKEFDTKTGAYSRFIYSYSPKNNASLSFYVIDKTNQAKQVKTWDRSLKDTYSYSLVKAEFHIISELCEMLTMNMPNFDDLLNGIYHGDGSNNLFLGISNDYEVADVDLIAQQLVEVIKHIKTNFDNYGLTQDLTHIKTYSDNRIAEQTGEHVSIINLAFEYGTPEWILRGVEERVYSDIIEILTNALNQ